MESSGHAVGSPHTGGDSIGKKRSEIPLLEEEVMVVRGSKQHEMPGVAVV
jgi:hypothetical protein